MKQVSSLLPFRSFCFLFLSFLPCFLYDCKHFLIFFLGFVLFALIFLGSLQCGLIVLVCASISAFALRKDGMWSLGHSW